MTTTKNAPLRSRLCKNEEKRIVTGGADGIDALDVTVLAGGPGPERDVSLNSGAAVHAALLRLGHRSVIRDISPEDLSALKEHADFVFIALHGEYGEGGAVQAELDKRSIAYCGSDVAGSRLAMDKVLAKERFEREGIATPKWTVVDSDALGKLGTSFAPPAVVKPVSSGSSVDTFIAHDAQSLLDVTTDVVAKYERALVEQYIDGPEYTVAILGGEALPVCEIQTDREFYDYYAKYDDDGTRYLFDLDLPEATLRSFQAIALQAHRSLGCRVFSRVDLMVDAETSSPYVLEVNTIPGFTSHSLLPKAALKIGLSFDDLCQRIIELSLREAG